MAKSTPITIGPPPSWYAFVRGFKGDLGKLSTAETQKAFTAYERKWYAREVDI